jgi:hypothetical protein
MQTNKVFGVGLSRTATKGLSVALNSIGIKTIHYDKSGTSTLLLAGIYKLPILEEYDALTDVQSVPFFRQLDEEYPNSKFILTVRDIDEWLESTKKHFRGEERENRHIRNIKHSEAHAMRAAVFGQLAWDRDTFRRRYYEHRAAVMDYFKDKDNLLVMNICEGDGWEKLCPFLGIDSPKHRFPDNVTASRLVRRQWRKQQRQQKESKNEEV